MSEDLTDEQRVVQLLRKGTTAQQTSAASMLWQVLAVGASAAPGRPPSIVLDAVVVSEAQKGCLRLRLRG